ncbi:MAG TPA: DNRLRE domain-containing protein, partial [Promineifilum sp.]|nr:DNRLRE domain-containing protein [Promineifilum sp.]
MKNGRVWIIALVLTLLGVAISTAQSQPPDGYSVMLRSIEATDLGVAHPIGLTYSPSAGVFMAIGRSEAAAAGTQIIAFDPFENPVGANALAAVLDTPLNAAFLPGNDSLLAVDGAGRQWVELGVGSRGLQAAPAQTLRRFDGSPLRLGNPRGMAVDEAGGRLFVLDAAGSNLVTVTADLSNLFNDLVAGRGHVERVKLTSLGDVSVRGLAYNPSNGHVYVGNAAGTTLHELSTDGRLLMQYDLSEMGLVDPQGMLFAPSADATDDPSVMNLYLADSGGAVNGGQVVEVSFQPPPPREVTSQATASLVNIIDTSKAAWNPSAPDAAGVAYRPSVGRLVISDSEVEEAHPDFQGYNVFQSTVGGTLDQTGLCSTQAFSNEPTGVAVNPNSDHIFFSDDNANRINEIDPVDGIYCNGNDTLTQLNTLTFGSDDPEGVSYGINKLFISDGINTEIYIVNLGANGIIGGNDDFMEPSIDTQSVGLRDPEGVEYNPNADTVFVISTVGGDRFLLELSMTGVVVNDFGLNFLGSIPRSGLALGPGSQNPSDQNIYLASRGVDNGADPNENDGKVYEPYVGLTSGPPPNTATPTNTPTAGPSPTPTPGPSILTFDAIDDAKIEQANPAVNFGGQTMLEVDGSPVRQFLVKFQVSGVTGPVTGARLRLYSIGTAVAGGNVHGAANTWDEATVNWNNAPAAGALLGSLGAVVPNTWYEVNLAAFVTGDGAYSFRIQPIGNDGAEYRSSEGGATTIPQLVVEFDNLVTPTVTSTPTETGTPTDT